MILFAGEREALRSGSGFLGVVQGQLDQSQGDGTKLKLDEEAKVREAVTKAIAKISGP